MVPRFRMQRINGDRLIKMTANVREYSLFMEHDLPPRLLRPNLYPFRALPDGPNL